MIITTYLTPDLPQTVNAYMFNIFAGLNITIK